MLTRFLVAVSMLLCVCLPAQAQPTPRAIPAVQDPLARMNESVDALTRKVWPSVVHIMVSSYAAREDPRGAAAVRRPAAIQRIGIRHRRGRLHPDQRACREWCAARPGRPAPRQRGRDPRDGVIEQDESRSRAHCRHHHRARSRAVEGRRLEVAGAAARDLFGLAPGGNGVRVRQPERTAQQPDARDGLGRGETSDARFAADLRADRCADQSREFRRPAGQHPRRGRGCQHVHHVAVGRERRPGLRHSERHRANGVCANCGSTVTFGGRKSA